MSDATDVYGVPWEQWCGMSCEARCLFLGDVAVDQQTTIERLQAALTDKHSRVVAQEAELMLRADEIERLRAGLDAVSELMRDSHGVDGLHLNGDVATWGELRSGGEFEQWLKAFDVAVGEVE